MHASVITCSTNFCDLSSLCFFTFTHHLGYMPELKSLITTPSRVRCFVTLMVKSMHITTRASYNSLERVEPLLLSPHLSLFTPLPYWSDKPLSLAHLGHLHQPTNPPAPWPNYRSHNSCIANPPSATCVEHSSPYFQIALFQQFQQPMRLSEYTCWWHCRACC